MQKQLFKIIAKHTTSNSLTFWPLSDDSLLNRCNSWGWRVAEGADIWSIVDSELELNKNPLQAYTQIIQVNSPFGSSENAGKY